MLEEPLSVDVVLHPLLKNLEITQDNLSLVLDTAPNITNVTFLSLCCDVKKQSTLETQLHSYVGSLTHLTALKLSCSCPDQLLAVLGLSCPHLKILDAEADSKTSITDRGLAFLSNCRQLHSVVLNDDGTDYDADDRYHGLTGCGVAQLIMSCPHLTLLTVDSHLMKAGINYLETVNHANKTFPLKYLHLRLTNSVTLDSAAKLFPSLTTLRLEEPVNTVFESLEKFEKLHSLTMSWYGWITSYPVQVQNSFENLKVLNLRNPKIQGFFDFDFLKSLGNWCLNLECLTIAIYTESLQQQGSTFNSTRRISPIETFFPKLKTLMFEGDIAIKLIETCLFAIKKLEKLSIYVHGFNFNSGVMDQLILNLVKNGHFSQLQYLQCYYWEVSLETLLYLIDQSSLRTIWGLDLLNMTEESKETIRNHIRKNNFNINLFDGLAPDPSFGLQFLDKKMCKQVDRLHEYTHQLELENMLIELSLL